MGSYISDKKSYTGISPSRLQASDNTAKFTTSQPGINTKSPEIHTTSVEGGGFKKSGMQSDNMNFANKISERRGMWT